MDFDRVVKEIRPPLNGPARAFTGKLIAQAISAAAAISIFWLITEPFWPPVATAILPIGPRKSSLSGPTVHQRRPPTSKSRIVCQVADNPSDGLKEIAGGWRSPNKASPTIGGTNRVAALARQTLIMDRTVWLRL